MREGTASRLKRIREVRESDGRMGGQVRGKTLPRRIEGRYAASREHDEFGLLIRWRCSNGGQCGRLFEHDVDIRPADAEGADAGAARGSRLAATRAASH